MFLVTNKARPLSISIIKSSLSILKKKPSSCFVSICGHAENADINASKNIKGRGYTSLETLRGESLVA